MTIRTYIIRTPARREWTAAQKLAPFVLETVLPLEWRPVDPSKGITKGKRQGQEVCARAYPLYPGYLFLKCETTPDFASMARVNFDNGDRVINSWLRDPNRQEPYTLTPMQTMLLRTLIPTFPDKLKRMNNERFKPGQKVRAVEGPFAGMVLTVEHDSGRHQIETVADIIGKLTPVKIDAKWLEAA